MATKNAGTRRARQTRARASVTGKARQIRAEFEQGTFDMTPLELQQFDRYAAVTIRERKRSVIVRLGDHVRRGCGFAGLYLYLKNDYVPEDGMREDEMAQCVVDAEQLDILISALIAVRDKADEIGILAKRSA